MHRLQTLQTKRTRISEYMSRDLNLLIALEHDPDVMLHLDGVVLDIEQNKHKLHGFIDYYQQQPGLGVWKACLNNSTHIGHAVLNRPALSTTGLREGPVQVGYTLHKKFWNQGYATELATAMLEHAFSILQLEHVIALTDKNNRASSRVMEKIGMHYQGVTNDYYEHELIWYKIERQEWLDFTT